MGRADGFALRRNGWRSRVRNRRLGCAFGRAADTRALALKFFERGQLTSGQAAVMCGLNRVDFLFEASRQGVPVADLDGAELDRELGAALG